MNESPAPTGASYAELHCKSHFSFLEGASSPASLIARAKALGYQALAITDECSVAGAVRAHEAARDEGLHLIHGAEMRLQWQQDGQQWPMKLVIHVMDRRGWGLLSRWITVCRRRSDKGTYEARCADIEGQEPTAPMLAGLGGCLALLSPVLGLPAEVLESQARWLQRWMGDRCGLALSLLMRSGEDQHQHAVAQCAALLGMPLVATGDVVMDRRSTKPLQDVMRATALGQTVAAAAAALLPNAENALRSTLRLAGMFPAATRQAALDWASRCTFSLDVLRYEYPREVVPPTHTPTTWLAALVQQGLATRYPGGAETKVLEQVAKELAIIERLSYEPYFLTVADIVHFAREQGILCQGRGSAANSAVCYALGITEVDPARSSMLFERFMSEERREPPDIDVDFEHQRREEVIQYLYRKYGRHRAALTAVVVRYRPKSALKDVGKALGLDPDKVERVIRAQPMGPDGQWRLEALSGSGLDPASPLVQRWLSLTRQLIDTPRHLSQHPGGFVIARDSLEDLVPIENAAMSQRTVIQWDKDDLDVVGLIKVDVLALGMLSAIRRALGTLEEKTGHAWRMQDIPPEDAQVYDMLCQADSVGVFQVESRAQMAMLPRLRPRTFYDLVVQVAIVRPGPIQGGMVHPYLQARRQGVDSSHIDPALRPALERTAGVPIFQEQVMQIAILAADFTPGEADQLRRGMAAWKRRGGLAPFREDMIRRMQAKGYSADYAERIVAQIQGFGEYGFPESHAASFALLVYCSAWIKCHHPDVFLVALLNSQPMGFYQPAQLVRDARDHGVTVRPVCVDASGAQARWVGPQQVRLGLMQISGLGQFVAIRIELERQQGPWLSVEDLVRRCELDAGEVAALAASGALACLSESRRTAMWMAAGVDTRPPPLLRSMPINEALPDTLAQASPQQLTALDYQWVGLSLNAHPVQWVRPTLSRWGARTWRMVQEQAKHGQTVCVAGLVTHRQRPPAAHGTVFITMEDETASGNLIVWPDVATRDRSVWRGASFLWAQGQWQIQEGVMHLIVRQLCDITPMMQDLRTSSRDFR